MFILKNAWRCISRSKARNILIGVIALVIAVSACIGLSIRQAAENARTSLLEGMSVTATISFDRKSMMNNIGKPSGNGGERPSFDRDQFAEMMGNSSSLTLEEYTTYATADSVDNFYYTYTVSVNGNDEFEPVTTEEEETTGNDSSKGQGGGMFGGMMGGMMGGMPGGMKGTGSDFSIVGYSSDAAMSEFADDVSSVTDGKTFTEGTSDYHCLISEELAIFNSLAVNDTIVVTNPDNEEETYTLTIVGIYTSTENNEFSMSRFGAGQDPANRIYMSATALELITSASASASTDDEDTALSGQISATYVFADIDSYERFESEARALGLSDSYTISSTDISSFEARLTPLNTLSTMAGWFLLVILIIGAIILVVLNIFNVRERKYEIGVLTAMGMKKRKVAAQFMAEILIVTMIAVFLGAGIGAVSSVPVTNALLAGQIADQQSQQSQIDQNFGRPGNMPNMPGGDMPSFDKAPDRDNGFVQFMGGAADYITEIDSAMNLTVVLQLLGIGLLLTLVAGAVAVLFVMRYDPLRILANRD